jgi:NAD(P)-dependent dehydrogenase (short-subunit alcohol dehydrogenase family)
MSAHGQVAPGFWRHRGAGASMSALRSDDPGTGAGDGRGAGVGRLDGKVAIVTGGARGIGLAYARRFVTEGASVMLADLDTAAGTEAADALGGGTTAAFTSTDVASPESVEETARATVDAFGGIDILVNNAALYGDWDMTDQSYEYLKRVFDVNLHGVWLMSRAVAPHLVGRGGGRIVNQSSGAAYNYRGTGTPADGFPGLSAFNYSQTKWGVVGLSKFMAAQLGAWNITVNVIAPGVIDTEATRKTVPKELLPTLAAQQAVPGVLTADDLTGAAVFFASDEARFVTGQVLVVDGGKYMPA